MAEGLHLTSINRLILLFVFSRFSSEDLLREFFEFYATFAFSKKSINIRKVCTHSKISLLVTHNFFVV